MKNKSDIEILVVDDEKYICGIIEESLDPDYKNITTMTSPEKALEHIKNNRVDLVLTDLVMGEKSGVNVLDTTFEYHKDAVVILMTAHPTVQTAITVLRKGAYDFLVKPFRLETLKSTIKRGLEHQRIIRENLSLQGQVDFLKLTQANTHGVDIESHLTMVANFCRKEFNAVGVSLIHVNHEDNSILRSIVDCDSNSKSIELTDESLVKQFYFTKSSKPIIHESILGDEKSQNKRIFISKPIFERRKLHGVLNVLIEARFAKVNPGQIDLLSIITSSAASALATNKLYDDLETSYLQAIKGLAKAIEARDEYTAGHTDRVTKIAEAIANYLGWNDTEIRGLIMGCTIHDIGKLGVPDSILSKPGKLTDEEAKIMQTHPEVGLKIIQDIDLLKPAIPYVSCHHEWYNGNGYPNGFKGEEIPIEGRLLTIADTFDAIISDRPYRKGNSEEVAVNELVKYSGIQFDPSLVGSFLDMLRSDLINLKEYYNRDFDFSFLDQVIVTEKVSV